MSAGVEPIRLITGSASGERTPLFSVDDREYTIPARPRPNIGLRYMRTLREKGDGHATAQLLEDLLGADAYLALQDHEDLTTEQLGQIMTIAQKLALGSLEDAGKGN